MRAEELAWLAEQDEDVQTHLATKIFCAKEAFYKCQYALTRAWLDFLDVRVEILGDTFRVAVVSRHEGGKTFFVPLYGRFGTERDLLIAGVAAEHENPSV